MTRSTIHHAASLTCLIGVALVLAGCAGGPNDDAAAGAYRTIDASPRRDTDAAIHANQAGLEHMEAGNLDKAADAFTRALTADVEFGPAHNNLGKVYYKQKDWYRAAWEFEYARKLLPRHAEPCNNLGLVLEEVGELDRAVDQYRQAAAIDASNIAYRANLARVLIRRGERTDEVRGLLQQVLAEDSRPEWLVWARQQQATMTGRTPQPQP